jgi:hypothetical protein
LRRAERFVVSAQFLGATGAARCGIYRFCGQPGVGDASGIVAMSVDAAPALAASKLGLTQNYLRQEMKTHHVIPAKAVKQDDTVRLAAPHICVSPINIFPSRISA